MPGKRDSKSAIAPRTRAQLLPPAWAREVWGELSAYRPGRAEVRRFCPTPRDRNARGAAPGLPANRRHLRPPSLMSFVYDALATHPRTTARLGGGAPVRRDRGPVLAAARAEAVEVVERLTGAERDAGEGRIGAEHRPYGTLLDQARPSSATLRRVPPPRTGPRRWQILIINKQHAWVVRHPRQVDKGLRVASRPAPSPAPASPLDHAYSRHDRDPPGRCAASRGCRWA
ncbi:MAG: hypothetical protein QOE61_1623 [Micromonosporaceae bacterium]|nr:hypothetical protein [Micromonosporaceae bacterium]